MLSHFDSHEVQATLKEPSAPATTPDTPTFKKIRRTTLKVTLAAAALFAADTARVVFFRGDATPVVANAPQAIRAPLASLSRDTPLPELFDALRNPKDASSFLKNHLRHDVPENPVAFTSTFRTSAKTFLQRGSGCCNNYAEFWGELWQATGRKPYLVSMWPTNQRCAEKKNEGIKGKGWHMITVFTRINPATGKEQLVIGDNDEVVYWDGTLESYVASKNMEILPYGGLRPFTPARDDHDFRAKICDLGLPNVRPEVSDDALEYERDVLVVAR